MKNTERIAALSLSNRVKALCRDDKILLQKSKGLLRHPFQRVFVGDITEDNQGSVIKGRFRFPLGSTMVAAAFTCVMVLNHIRAMMVLHAAEQKNMISFLFLIFYLAVLALFISGKLLYQRQEEEVIHFLEKIL